MIDMIATVHKMIQNYIEALQHKKSVGTAQDQIQGDKMYLLGLVHAMEVLQAIPNELAMAAREEIFDWGKTP